MKAFMGLVVIMLATIGLVYLALYELFDGLSPARIAGVVLAGILALAAGILLTLALVNRLLGRARMTPARHYELQPDEWTELDTYRPPQEQLPAPARVVVPRYSNMGTAQPWNAPAPKVELQTTTDNGTTLTVPLRFLLRFASLDGPSRAQWSGKSTTYSDCRNFFRAHGLLDDSGKWKPTYPIDSRRRWLEQFDSDR